MNRGRCCQGTAWIEFDGGRGGLMEGGEVEQVKMYWERFGSDAAHFND